MRICLLIIFKITHIPFLEIRNPVIKNPPIRSVSIKPLLVTGRMIQERLREFGRHMALTSEGTWREVHLEALAGRYVVFVTFYAAFHEISTAEVLEFSAVLQQFHDLETEVIGVVRESEYAVTEWAATMATESSTGKV